jgi:hypothetical protein
LLATKFGALRIFVSDFVGPSRALNLDAERAFAALGGDLRKEKIVPWVFRQLVKPGAGDEESRRPSRSSNLGAVCDASEPDVLAAVRPFRERGFLVISGDKDPIVDISHESLIRQWGELKDWLKTESDSASTYTRLADWVKDGYGLYFGVALAEALQWKETERPNDAWAQRYRPGKDTFREVIDFLDRSRKASDDAKKLAERYSWKWRLLKLLPKFLLRSLGYV